MELFTGKAKILWKTFVIENITMQSEYVQEAMNYHHFNKLPLSMQFGVVEDFAEDLGYNLTLHLKERWCDIHIYKNKKIVYFKTEMAVTRKEARLECIKELNNLINKEDESKR